MRKSGIYTAVFAAFLMTTTAFAAPHRLRHKSKMWVMKVLWLCFVPTTEIMYVLNL